jgi:hypothetical protein
MIFLEVQRCVTFVHTPTLRAFCQLQEGAKLGCLQTQGTGVVAQDLHATTAQCGGYHIRIYYQCKGLLAQRCTVDSRTSCQCGCMYMGIKKLR